MHRDHLYVATSSCHGLGLFSREPIAEGEVVLAEPAMVIPLSQLAPTKGGNMVENYGFEWRDGWIALGTTIAHMNHARLPNCTIELVELPTPTIVATARKAIGRDEELTIHYGGKPGAPPPAFYTGARWTADAPSNEKPTKFELHVLYQIFMGRTPYHPEFQKEHVVSALRSLRRQKLIDARSGKPTARGKHACADTKSLRLPKRLR